MRIGVLGGTFDPIHRAHLTIAACALREYGLDEVWFMPAGDPYFKEGSPVTGPGLRLAMTKACIDAFGEPRFRCSDFEIRDRERTYTAETFRKLHELYPGDRFYLIMGLDSLEALPKWYRPELLLQNAVILCALRRETRSGNETFSGKGALVPDRDAREIPVAATDAKDGMDCASAKEDWFSNTKAPAECAAPAGTKEGTEDERTPEEDAIRFFDAVRVLQEEYGSAHPDIRQLHCPEINISSTMIRDAVLNGGKLESFVTPAVADFIEKHGLYR